jgi:hypothetical protein
MLCCCYAGPAAEIAKTGGVSAAAGLVQGTDASGKIPCSLIAAAAAAAAQQQSIGSAHLCCTLSTKSNKEQYAYAKLSWASETTPRQQHELKQGHADDVMGA